MGTTRNDLFTEAQNQLSAYAKVIGHPARNAILEILMNSESCINSDLVEELGLAQATVSQHLSELKRMGLIMGTLSGTRMCYCIDPEGWKRMKLVLTEFLNKDPKLNHPCC
jgi:ArsR family transcriptional regulator